MLHRIPAILFSPDTLFGFTMMLVLVVVVGELSAAWTNWNVAQIMDDRQSHVGLYLRHMSLPNYWIWYQPEDLYQVIRAQDAKLVGFLVHTVFNAACSTIVFGLYTAFVTMFLAHRALAPNSALLRVIWIPSLLAFLADFTEDIMLILATIEFPEFSRWVGMTAAWSSLLKYVFWFFTALVWIVLATKRFVAPPVKARTV
jgi:hypothetical protein